MVSTTITTGFFFGVKALTFGEHRYKREETTPSRLVTAALKINETTTSKRGVVVLAITKFLYCNFAENSVKINHRSDYKKA